MMFTAASWRMVALGLVVVNLLGAGYAIATGEPTHAGVHAVLAMAFGVWSQRLKEAPRASALDAGIEGLEFEAGKLRQELSDMQERLDFTERLLARKPDARRVDREPPAS